MKEASQVFAFFGSPTIWSNQSSEMEGIK